MRTESTLSGVLALLTLAASASGQYGGGFSPTKPAPPAPAAPAPAPTPAAPEEPDDEAEPTAPETVPAPASAPTAPAPKTAERFQCAAPEKSWAARLEDADRAAIDERLGYGLPALPNDLDWVGSSTVAPSIDGKVIVIQTFDVNSGGTGPIEKASHSLKPFEENTEFVLVGVQVPNKVEASTPRVAKCKAKAALCVDTNGEWCDALGAFKRPVNFVVDRAGAIRYAGLTDKGLAAAVKLLLDEPRRSGEPATRPETTATATDSSAAFPVFTEPVRGANDLRGKPSPTLQVDQWMSKAPNTQGKVIIVDFFFTGCPPCRAMIPHMNEIAGHYGDAVAVVGVSWENKSTYDSGLTKHKLKQNDFKYSIGLDSSRRTVGAFGVQSYPNVAVISADGVVRWQGHPASLTQGVLDPIVTANQTLSKSSAKGAPRGWANSTEGSSKG